MLELSHNVMLDESELEFSAIRAQGAGGQNVNKVSSAIHLRFDIRASSLPEFFKERLLALSDHRITREGVVVIKAQQYRNQDQNREDAVRRLQELINSAVVIQKKRRPTKASRAAQQKRIDRKTARGRTKSLRGRVDV